MKIHAWRGLLFLLGMQVALAGTRLAVWSEPARQDAAALLVAELSARGANSGYELLEREEIARAVAEQAGPGVASAEVARAGRLLGAAGVAWLTEVKIDGREKLVLRLSATESGLVAGWLIDDAGLADPARWAARAARQLEVWRPKLAATRESARAVSLLNLRASGGSAASATREQALTALLGQAMASGSRLWVLERWRLDDLALETVLAGEAKDGFWQGAALVDGSFTESEGELVLSMRLRLADGRQERWTASGRDAGRLIAGVADEVARRLGTEASAATWDRAAEAREFLDEARWAARLNLHGKVVEAVEAAITLGEDGPEARRLRYLAHGRDVWGAGFGLMMPPGAGADFSPMTPRFAPPARGKLERARQALAFFNDFRASEAGRVYGALPGGPPRHGPMMNARPLTLAECDAVELLNGAARLLRTGYFASGADAATEAELAGLRADARALFEREFAALGLRSRPRAAGAVLSAGDRHRHETMAPNTLLVTGFTQGAWWAERLSQHQGFARRLLVEDFEGEPDLSATLIRLITPLRADAWEVDWATRDANAARAEWARTAREWLQADDAGLALAGAFQLLALNSPFPSMPPEMGPQEGARPRFGTPEEAEARTVAGLGFFAKNVEALAGGRLPREYVTEALMLVPERVPVAVRDAWAERLASWWERGEGRPGAEDVLMDARLRFTPEQQARLRAAQARREGARPAGGEAVVLAPLKVPEARQTKLELTRAWIVPEARALDAGKPSEFRRQPSIRWLERSQGRVRVISEESGGPSGARRMRLTEVGLATFRERELGTWTIEDTHSSRDHLFPAYAMAGRWVFSVEKDGLWRRDPAAGEATRVVLPMAVNGPIWAIGKHVYATWRDGGIVRVEVEGGAWEILADSRRRPARGTLDDCSRYEVARIWRGGDGVLRAVVSLRSRVHAYDEAAGAWRIESEQPNANQPNFRYQRRECLERLQDIESAVQGYGDSELRYLLNDLERSGKWRQSVERVPAVYLLGEHRPPAGYRQDRAVVFHPFGGMATGGDVWALYHSAPHPSWSPRLVWLPRPGKEIVAVELRMPDAWMDYMARRHPGLVYAGLGGEYARLLAGPEGLVFYAMNGAAWWFVPKAELATAGVYLE